MENRLALEPTVISLMDFPEQGQPFSIYLKLEEGTRADFEVVAKSSLALISALRELVDFADPTLDLKVTIQNGEEGSLRLNTFIKILTGRDDASRQARQRLLDWVIVGSTVFLLEATATHYYDKFLSWIDQRVIEAIDNGENPEEVHKAASDCRKIVEGVMKNDSSARHVRRFFEELRDDPNIVGVGVSQSHDDVPAEIVPRSEFLVRSRPAIEPAEETKRDRIERITLLLVQPRLLGDDKAWRFSVGGNEFAAKVSDRKFIEDTLSGKNSIPLVEGVYLDVDLRLDERKIGEAWVIRGRVVQQVYGVTGGKIQGSLLGPIQ